MIFEYKYSVDNDCYKFTYNCELKSEFHIPHLNVLAQKCAEHYFNNSDSEYREWPKVFTIYNSEGAEVGRFEVEMEFVPNFYAYEIKENKHG